MVAAPLAVVAGEIVPQGEHDTVQVTPLFAESLVTVAVNCVVVPAATVAEPGATETVIVGTAAVTVMVAEADFDASATEVAVMVTVKPADGGLAGAV